MIMSTKLQTSSCSLISDMKQAFFVYNKQ